MGMTELKLEGVHHISCITADATANVEFYAGVMGMRLVKKTVNQDDPSVYHLFFGDEKGTPGFDLTFFEYPGARKGRAGAGMVHRILWRVGSGEALDYWEKRLADNLIGTERTPDGLLFADPEGLHHELLVYGGTDERLVPGHIEVPPEFALQGFHGARAYSASPQVTAQVLEEIMGFTPSEPGEWVLEGDQRSGVYYLDPAPEERGIPSAGTVHHIAWASTLEQHDDWQRRVTEAGLHATPVIDRFYFRAIYYREPGGVLFELATMGPGFASDEDPEHLGESLSLPPAFEDQRERIEEILRPVPDPRQWRPKQAS